MRIIETSNSVIIMSIVEYAFQLTSNPEFGIGVKHKQPVNALGDAQEMDQPTQPEILPEVLNRDLIRKVSSIQKENSAESRVLPYPDSSISIEEPSTSVMSANIGQTFWERGDPAARQQAQQKRASSPSGTIKNEPPL